MLKKINKNVLACVVNFGVHFKAKMLVYPRIRFQKKIGSNKWLFRHLFDIRV